ncbi:MAG: 23S rRNA (guanosine(2251)-2'-O)-methyltransferase RlmB [Candidatus Rifleibacteriota bacterium]
MSKKYRSGKPGKKKIFSSRAVKIESREPVDKRPRPDASACEEELKIKGRHEVLAAMVNRTNHKLHKVYIQSGAKGKIIDEIKKLASALNIKLEELENEKFIDLFGSKSQGVGAVASAFIYRELEEMIDLALEGSQVLVALNRLEDPRNLGAIVRTAEAIGAAGIIIGKHRCAGMTEWAIKTSQGAGSVFPVAKVTNMADAIEAIKARGFWATGLEGGVEKKYCDLRYNGPTLLVAGGEDAGLGNRVKKACDELVSIPLRGETTSLNVSVSTAIVLCEIARQKDFFSK